MPNYFGKFEAPAGETEKTDFDRQYGNPEKIAVGGEKFLLYDVTPEKAKSEVPVLFCPGWIEDPVNHKKATEVLYKEGRRVIFPDAPHGISPEAMKTDPETFHKAADVELRKAASLLATLDEKKIAKADVIAHSEGAINSIIAATLYPERFRNIVLVSPAGMVGKNSLGRLLLGAFREGRAENKRQKKHPTEFWFIDDPERGKMYFRQTWPQTLKEVVAISNSDIRAMLEDLKKKGIGISIIHSADDKMFPMRRVQKAASAKQLHGFYSVAGGHQQYLLEPSRYAKLAAKALDALEALPGKNKGGGGGQ